MKDSVQFQKAARDPEKLENITRPTTSPAPLPRFTASCRSCGAAG